MKIDIMGIPRQGEGDVPGVKALAGTCSGGAGNSTGTTGSSSVVPSTSLRLGSSSLLPPASSLGLSTDDSSESSVMDC